MPNFYKEWSDWDDLIKHYEDHLLNGQTPMQVIKKLHNDMGLILQEGDAEDVKRAWDDFPKIAKHLITIVFPKLYPGGWCDESSPDKENR